MDGVSDEDSEEESDDGQSACVFDIGSGLSKVGFGGDEEPLSVFPTIVGKPRTQSTQQSFYYGEAVKLNRNHLYVRYPVEHGVITNWDDMEKLWTLCFEKELRVDSAEHFTMLTEGPLVPKANREKCTEIMIEQCSVPGMYLAKQPILSLYSSGRTTGIVLDSGAGQTHIVPIYEGYQLPHAIPRMNIAGRDITWYLQKSLSEQGYSFYLGGDSDLIRRVKEKLGYVALDYDMELKVPITAEPQLAVIQEYYVKSRISNRIQIMDAVFGRNISEIVSKYLPQTAEQDFTFQSLMDSAKETTYEMPDGNLISIGNQRFRAPEIVFRPELCGREEWGLIDHLDWSINRCDEDIRKDLYRAIILSGGSTMFKGFAERMKKDLKAKVSDSVKIDVIAPAKRHLSAWMGGSILSALSTFESMWLTKDEYDESGPALIHKKCF